MRQTCTHAKAPAFALLALAAVTGCGNAPGGAARERAIASESPAYASEFADLVAATEKYRDVEAAKADGYIRDPMDQCVTAPAEGLPAQLGGMGIHYFRPDLLRITGTSPRVDGTGTHTDFAQPAVLIYEPQADGSLELVAIENVVFEAAWKASGQTGAPRFRDYEYYHMVDNPRTAGVDEAHMFEPHYELHLWL